MDRASVRGVVEGGLVGATLAVLAGAGVAVGQAYLDVPAIVSVIVLLVAVVVAGELGLAHARRVGAGRGVTLSSPAVAKPAAPIARFNASPSPIPNGLRGRPRQDGAGPARVTRAWGLHEAGLRGGEPHRLSAQRLTEGRSVAPAEIPDALKVAVGAAGSPARRPDEARTLAMVVGLGAEPQPSPADAPPAEVWAALLAGASGIAAGEDGAGWDVAARAPALPDETEEGTNAAPGAIAPPPQALPGLMPSNDAHQSEGDRRGGVDAWRRVAVRAVRAEGPDLTARQTALLLTVHASPAPKTVGELARELGLAKPVISRAVDTLAGLGLLQRRRDADDRRKVYIDGTAAGAAFVRVHAAAFDAVRAHAADAAATD